MGRFAEKYTQRERQALAEAVVDRGLPARRVVDMAGAGELRDDLGPLPAFETNRSTVSDQARRLRLRRAGLATSELAAEPHRDAIEKLRVRLVSTADLLLADFERQLRRDASKADPERHRQITRCVKEAAALPERNDPRPKQPGTGTGAERVGGETSGGLAGDILRAAGMGGRPSAANGAGGHSTR